MNKLLDRGYISSIIIFLFVCIFLIILFILLMNGCHTRQRERLRKGKTIFITNDSTLQQNIKVGDRDISIKPDQNVEIVIHLGEIIKNERDKIKFDDAHIKQIIITTEGNIVVDNTATSNTRLVNATPNAIVLYYEDKHRKKRSVKVPPHSEIKGPTILKNQRWFINNQEHSFRVKINSVPKRRLVWNGIELK